MAGKLKGEYSKKDSLWVIHGDKYKQMTLSVLEHLDPVRDLEKNAKIGIKPNLVCAYPAERGATTHPEIVEGIVIYLRNKGFENISILESSWVGDSTERAFEVCGYIPLGKKYKIPLVDLKKDSCTKLQYKGVYFLICDQMLDHDFVINVPLIKGHCQTQITCALKNMKGVIPDEEKRRFHTMGLHRPIAFLNKLVKQDFIIADDICADPYFEEGGRPGDSNRIVAGYDPVLMDSYAAQSLGYEPEEVEYIKIAAGEGVGRLLESMDQVRYLESQPDGGQPVAKIKPRVIPVIKNQREACSACYSSLLSGLSCLSQEKRTEIELDRIAIGQGWQDQNAMPEMIGIGDCTSEFKCTLPGCPPSADEVKRFLLKS